jgi:hypothetical protein
MSNPSCDEFNVLAFDAAHVSARKQNYKQPRPDRFSSSLTDTTIVEASTRAVQAIRNEVKSWRSATSPNSSSIA